MEFDKASAYANALDSDIAVEPFNQVRNSVLWRGFVGTIYGCMVSTDNGTSFSTSVAALENARLFREQCREIVRVRAGITGGATGGSK